MSDNVCSWDQQTEGGPWETECGHTFEVMDGTPAENDMLYCCFCGAMLKEFPYTEDTEDE